jgi:hypothetical protein
MKVYLVLHHEIFQWGPSLYLPDDIVFHVATSVDKALTYIKKVGVQPYSWWEIQEQTVDRMEEPKHIGWYGRTGRRLKQPPFAKAIRLFKKCKRDPRHILNIQQLCVLVTARAWLGPGFV